MYISICTYVYRCLSTIIWMYEYVEKHLYNINNAYVFKWQLFLCICVFTYVSICTHETENNLFAFISFNHPQQLHTHTPYDDWAKNEFYTEKRKNNKLESRKMLTCQRNPPHYCVGKIFYNYTLIYTSLIHAYVRM